MDDNDGDYDELWIANDYDGDEKLLLADEKWEFLMYCIGSDLEIL